MPENASKLKWTQPTVASKQGAGGVPRIVKGKAVDAGSASRFPVQRIEGVAVESSEYRFVVAFAKLIAQYVRGHQRAKNAKRTPE